MRLSLKKKIEIIVSTSWYNFDVSNESNRYIAGTVILFYNEQINTWIWLPQI